MADLSDDEIRALRNDPQLKHLEAFALEFIQQHVPLVIDQAIQVRRAEQSGDFSQHSAVPSVITLNKQLAELDPEHLYAVTACLFPLLGTFILNHQIAEGMRPPV